LRLSFASLGIFARSIAPALVVPAHDDTHAACKRLQTSK
jgi:hypothetical protein